MSASESLVQATPARVRGENSYSIERFRLTPTPDRSEVSCRLFR